MEGAAEQAREALDISEYKRKLWLVKVPTEVAEAWNSVTGAYHDLKYIRLISTHPITEDDVDLGTLTYYPEEATANKKRKVRVQFRKSMWCLMFGLSVHSSAEETT
jgi:hypothetical protein